MISNKSPIILVLGAQGMTGHTVYNYLQNFYDTYGTVRDAGEESTFIHFDVLKDPLNILLIKVKKIDYIINCIGILKNNKNLSTIRTVNSIFPHQVAQFADEIGAKLIHISTDAVFADNTNEVYEDSKPNPDDLYGKTKYEGEPVAKNALTIRTSFLGLDNLKHKGLLEFILRDKAPTGFTNQNWSGCTTLQFARLCSDIIQTNRFDMLKKKSRVYHFAPIRNVSKHDIIKTFLKLKRSNKSVKPGISNSITRSLSSRYSNELQINHFSSNLLESLQELIDFEQSNNG